VTAERCDGHVDATAARARLAALQRGAAGAYATITEADAALRTVAARRVAAERVLRHAAAVRQAAVRAAAAHARAQPGLFGQLASGLRAGAEFAAHVRARGEAAAALRRLTAECAAARAEITACLGDHGQAG
jgi:hypothetical protein